LLFSLVLSFHLRPELRDLTSSYEYILKRNREALAGLLPDLEHAGTSDLSSSGRKFSGNAQQRKSSHLLHHGTLLYDFDLSQLSRYLRMPKRQPDYRGQRTHTDFLINLQTTSQELEARLRREWQAETVVITWPAMRLRQLVEEKYSQNAW